MDQIGYNAGRTPFTDISNTIITGNQNESNSLGPIVDAKERKRQRDRERYAAMTVEEKNEKNRKRREARQRNKGLSIEPLSSIEDVNTDQACEVVSFPDDCSTIDFTNLSTQDIAGGDEQVNLDAYDDSDWLHRNETFQANNIVTSKDLLTPGCVHETVDNIPKHTMKRAAYFSERYKNMTPVERESRRVIPEFAMTSFLPTSTQTKDVGSLDMSIEPLRRRHHVLSETRPATLGRRNQQFEAGIARNVATVTEDTICDAMEEDDWTHPHLNAELHNNGDDDEGVIFEEDDDENDGYLFAGQYDEIDEDIEIDGTQDESTATDLPDPYDKVYSNVPEETHMLKEGGAEHKHLELYFYDDDPNLEHRYRKCREECQQKDKYVIKQLVGILRENPYSEHLRSMGHVENLDDYRITLNLDQKLNQKTYNTPLTSEVAAVWIEGSERRGQFTKSVMLHGKDRSSHGIRSYHGCYDALSYPLFFPRGELGWHTNIPKIRPGIFNPILHGKRLFQQFAVDTYVKIESSRLDFIRKNQDRLRADLYQGLVDSMLDGDIRAEKVGKRTVLSPSFIGGPCDMRRRYMDAMALVRKFGKPDIFLTMTCNPNWDEIRTELLPGQTPQDRSDLVVRVFHAKLQELKHRLTKHDILGKVRAYVYVVEFQKRGLPHAHFLLIMQRKYKLTCPEQYDLLISAEIPDKKYPELRKMVIKHMMHGPCGSLNPICPCTKGHASCKNHYPRPFYDATLQGKDSYPVYRRRDDGRKEKVRGFELDNRWVVPYNPYLLWLFNCHINVEACRSIKAVKYMFKYIYKGHDRASVVMRDASKADDDVDEIKQYRDASCSSIFQTCTWWRFTSAKWSSESSTVQSGKGKVWQRRKRDTGGQVGRIISAHPAEGERYYLRVLLNHVTGATCYVDLRTMDGVTLPTFREAAERRGLLESDNTLDDCLTERALFQMPSALRRLFATILVYCEPSDVAVLWQKHLDAMSEDYQHRSQSKTHVEQMVLIDIRNMLQSMGKDIKTFLLPPIIDTYDDAIGTAREVYEEESIVAVVGDVALKDSLNEEQRAAYDKILSAVDTDQHGLFFVDGPGGTGKTYLYRVLLTTLRSQGKIAVATTTSSVAASIMPGGRTAHSRFKIPLTIDDGGVCSFTKQSGTAELLRKASLIIWDEASMTKRQAVEALDNSMRDIMGRPELPFGGKTIVFGGDFRQVLPVVRKGSRAQVVASSLRMSYLWESMSHLKLVSNMRAKNDPWFAEYLLRVGGGTEVTNSDGDIRLPDEVCVPYSGSDNDLDNLIDFVFPNLNENMSDSTYITSRAILSTRNDWVDMINAKMIDRFQGEHMVYHSFDSAMDDPHNYYPPEFLNTLTPNGLPPHVLKLKIGCPVILLRNIDPANGLCNGTRLVVRGFQRNSIDAEIVLGQYAGKRIFLPRIPLCPSDDEMFPFQFKRKQFPIRLSFAMIVNKAQGQTIPNVGVYLPEPVFSHGQLYVALSRATARSNIKILAIPAVDGKKRSRKGVRKNPTVDCGTYTKNIVYKEVLTN
ncbi:hypothetical protein ZEAMMB73_Zm00001d040413 [Zea mays]|uniref:ATP-dependent DNA helicase n=1 Tax=Zea mays TaxID=4577 RepID=A0A1D6MQL4_MAIZE|nr:hypothetical protein ZEAMMB73_Zm00001d040413 [Zea mays]